MTCGHMSSGPASLAVFFFCLVFRHFAPHTQPAIVCFAQSWRQIFWPSFWVYGYGCSRIYQLAALLLSPHRRHYQLSIRWTPLCCCIIVCRDVGIWAQIFVDTHLPARRAKLNVPSIGPHKVAPPFPPNLGPPRCRVPDDYSEHWVLSQDKRGQWDVGMTQTRECHLQGPRSLSTCGPRLNFGLRE